MSVYVTFHLNLAVKPFELKWILQDADVPKTLKETETTEKEVKTTIPEKPDMEVPAPEAASTEQSKEEEESKEAKNAAAAVTVIVETTEEVVIEKREEKAREVIIEDPTTAAEDEKLNGKTEA